MAWRSLQEDSGVFFENIFQRQPYRERFRPFHQRLPGQKAVFHPEVHISVKAPAVITRMEDDRSRMKVRDKVQHLMEPGCGNVPNFFVHRTRVEVHERSMESYGNILLLQLLGRLPDLRPGKVIKRCAAEINFRLQPHGQHPRQIFQEQGQRKVDLHSS